MNCLVIKFIKLDHIIGRAGKRRYRYLDDQLAIQICNPQSRKPQMKRSNAVS